MSELGLPGTPAHGHLTRVYVWELPVRLAHWLIVLSIVVLSVTGLYLGNPFHLFGRGQNVFTMGWMRTIHLYFAIAFSVALVMRFFWMFTGNKYAHWDKFIPVTRHRFKGIFRTIRFYLFALRKPPGFVGHNPLAGLVYVAVYALLVVQLATGLALHAAEANVGSPMARFLFLGSLFGGLATTRLIHHVVMWLLIGFGVHHVYSAMLMAQVEANGTMESILSGWKFVPPEDLVYSGYRFRERRKIHEEALRAADPGGGKHPVHG